MTYKFEIGRLVLAFENPNSEGPRRALSRRKRRRCQAPTSKGQGRRRGSPTPPQADASLRTGRTAPRIILCPHGRDRGPGLFCGAQPRLRRRQARGRKAGRKGREGASGDAGRGMKERRIGAMRAKPSERVLELGWKCTDGEGGIREAPVDAGLDKEFETVLKVGRLRAKIAASRMIQPCIWNLEKSIKGKFPCEKFVLEVNVAAVSGSMVVSTLESALARGPHGIIAPRWAFFPAALQTLKPVLTTQLLATSVDSAEEDILQVYAHNLVVQQV
ncbi:hypothetical protein DFH09DRAFT_1098306 [Mycena vulgaris]|nr:hypothetical protein DFH09DRAFT_1098306 [Mycena vulgaris]